ncbi:MAG: hypothetical protein MJ118_00750 [Clostridia bacterium]|nr:hypothetical protein [Clostridia bacterium]
MSVFTLSLDPAAERFYRRVAQSAGISIEQVLQDALFKLAGELSLEALAGRDAKYRRTRCNSGRNLIECF